ncbi:2-C-methyl-D-erythritol 4-phosphate cytidylyltransferase [Gynuella sunshinyii]|nr:2-C-methyl-D-erythritol 4-phosphate cytidylyltransferase [Gynuella sunshinyii]
MNNTETPVWVILPAAGIGSRMRAEYPKQYLPVQGRMIIEWTLELFLSIPYIQGIVVSVRHDDQRWAECDYYHDPRIVTVYGGKERSDSVLSAVNWVYEHQPRSAWVMIHDVVRPCVRTDDLNRLYSRCLNSGRSAILAVPVSDTIKHVQHETINHTVDRTVLWQAQTPQMFPLEALKRAFENVIRDGHAVTDDASVMELYGHVVDVVTAHRDNIKITTPEDLELVEMILARGK